MPDATSYGSEPTLLERGDGAAEIRFQRRGGVSALAYLYQHAPCRVLFPKPPTGELPTAVMLTTSGGLTGGDRIAISIAAETGAQATVTTQAAEKIYRSAGPDCVIDVNLSVERDSWLEYLPQETILFEGARLRRRTQATVAPGGRLLAGEMLVFGRLARGELFRHGLMREEWRVRREGPLAWMDVLLLNGEIEAKLDAAAGFDGARALASSVYVGDDAPSLLETARALTVEGDCRCGVSLVRGVLVARFLGPDPVRVRQALMRYLGGMRETAAGLSNRMPPVWYH